MLYRILLFSVKPQHESAIQFSSLAQSCPTLCDPMDCSTPGLPVHHQFLEFAQTHVYRVGDTIQPSHPLSSPSPPAFNLSQHQGLLWSSKWQPTPVFLPGKSHEQRSLRGYGPGGHKESDTTKRLKQQ